MTFDTLLVQFKTLLNKLTAVIINHQVRSSDIIILFLLQAGSLFQTSKTLYMKPYVGPEFIDKASKMPDKEITKIVCDLPRFGLYYQDIRYIHGDPLFVTSKDRSLLQIAITTTS